MKRVAIYMSIDSRNSKMACTRSTALFLTRRGTREREKMKALAPPAITLPELQLHILV